DSMISTLMSFSSSVLVMLGKFVVKVRMQALVQAASGNGQRSLRSPLRWVDIGAYMNAVVHAPVGYPIPGFALHQTAGAHAYDYRRNYRGAAHGDGAGAPVESRQAVAWRARAFGEHDQCFAVAQHLRSLVQHVEALVVADVACRGDRPAGE